MKKILKKRFFIFLFPILAIAVTIGTLVFSSNTEELKQTFDVSVNKEQTYRKVYMLDNDNYLVPLTFSFDKKELLADDILYVISMLRDDSQMTSKGYKPLINKDVKIQSIDLENNILNIDFSKEFNDMESSKEEKIIESLTWTMTQYDEIDGITLSIDGIKLEELPNSKIVLPDVLDKTIGINKYYDTTGNIYNTTSVTVFYEKENYGEMVYVPVTIRVIEEDNYKMSVYNAMNKDISVVSGLRKIEELDYIDDEVSIDFNSDSLSVALLKESLVEENLVDETIYELFMMTYNDLNNIDINVSFQIDEENVSVNGYENVEDFKVGSIIYNEIKA